MRLRSLVIALLAATALAAGCGGDSSDDYQPTPLATPKPIRDEVWDRSYSECASNPLPRLAAKYHVDASPQPVAQAVGAAWTQVFGGRTDAVGVGRDGCLQGIRSK